MKNLFLVLLFPSFLISQENIYKPVFKPSYKDRVEALLRVKQTYVLKNIEGSHKNKIKKHFQERDENVLKKIEDSVFIFNKEYTSFLEVTLNKIYEANPLLKNKGYQFFFNKEPFPNAASFGNDVFMLNTGLFLFLESEDEFAFIICHEIAHQVLNHVNKGITEYVHKVNSKEVKKEIKNVSLTIYGKNKAAMNLQKKIVFNFLKKSRQKELQADSLGLEFYKKTIYNSEAALTALEKLKKSNDGLFANKIKIDSLLNFKEYRFKEFWLEEEDTFFDTNENKDDYSYHKDSLKSHPAIKDRIRVIKSKITDASKTNQKNFIKIKEFAKYQQVVSLLDANQIDFAFYKLLEEIQYKKATKQSYIQLSTALKKLYMLKESHNLGEYVPQNNPFAKEKNINNIRQFLHNIELKEIKNIGFYYCKKHSEALMKSKEFSENINFFNTLKNQ